MRYTGQRPGLTTDEQARLSIRYTERRAESDIEASVDSRGDAYDNALAASVIGLFNTEVIRHAGPWRSLDDVEYSTI